MIFGNLEKDLLLAIASGRVLNLTRRARRTVPADLLREIFTHELELEADPRGVQITGARVKGLLDLESVTSQLRLSFQDCYFPSGVRAWGAQLPRLNFKGCTARGLRGEPAIDLDSCSLLEGLNLFGLQAEANSDAGALRLSGARITGQLDIRQAHVENSNGPAISADSILVTSSGHFEGAHALGSGEATIRLQAAQFGGNVHFEGATIINRGGGAALLAQKLASSGRLRLVGAQLKSADAKATVNCDYASLDALDLDSCTLQNKQGPVIAATGIKVNFVSSLADMDVQAFSPDRAIFDFTAAETGSLHLVCPDLLHCTGPLFDGTRMRVQHGLSMLEVSYSSESGDILDLSQAVIGGDLTLKGCSLGSENSEALAASGIVVSGTLGMDHVTATTTSTRPLVDISDSDLGSLIVCGHSRLENKAGPALFAENAHLRAEVLLEQLSVRGTGRFGAVRFTDARVEGNLAIRKNVVIANRAGPSVSADGLRTSGRVAIQDVVLDAEGEAALRMIDAHIGSQCTIVSSIITNAAGPGILGQGMVIARDLALEDLRVTGQGPVATIDLSRARIELALVVSGVQVLNREHPSCLWSVDQLSYRGLPKGVSGADWLRIISSKTVAYSPQAYQQLATALTGAGHDGDARRVLIAQRRDQLERAEDRTGAKLWGRFLGFSLAFGYQPWRALLGLAAVAIVAIVALGWTELGTNGLARTPISTGLAKDSAGQTVETSSTAAPSESCSRLERSLVAVEIAIPLIKAAPSQRCITNPRAQAGRTISGLSPAIQLICWALATLFVAGFTSVIRRT